MDSGDKAVAIFAVAMGLGVVGGLIVGWPAVVAAAVSIIFIARNTNPPEVPGHGE
jgi:hypothetical protein